MFDTVEHPLYFTVLKSSILGSYLEKVLKLYAYVNSSVKQQNGTTQRFLLERSIRQGCSGPLYLLFLVAQLFCHFIKTSNLKSIYVAGKNIIICQLANDAALF